MALQIITLTQTPCSEICQTSHVIIDALGRKIEFASPPQRIVSLYGAFNEILIALEAHNLIVARTKADQNLEEIAHLPSIGTHMRPNPELVMAAAPDLVIQIKGRNEKLQNLELLERQGIKCLIFEIESFADLFNVTEQLGKILNIEEKAAGLIADWKKRLHALGEKKLTRKPKVFYEVRYPNLLANGACGIVNDIIKAAGGENVLDVPKKLVRVNEEILFIKNPDVYISQIGPMNPEHIELKKRENFKNLSSRLKVIYVDERKFARPGPRSIEAAEELHDFLFANGRNDK